AQDAALTTRGLAHQGARGIRWVDDAGGVELHELRIAQPRPRLDGETERVAGVLVAARGGASPDAVVPARGEDDGVGVDEVAGAVVQIEAVGAEHGTVGNQQTRDVYSVENRNLQLRCPIDEG